MIIVNVIGGLGNQMFQYAAGRSLSLDIEQPLRLDVSGFANYGLHQGFELDSVFACPIKRATAENVHEILGWQSKPFAKRILSRPFLARLRRHSFIVEPYFHYWPGLSHVPCDSYLSGYWQSEKYFKAHEEVIRRDFAFKEVLSGRNKDIAEQIASSNAVSLHVRRGDYVNNPKTQAAHGLCSVDYYQTAIRYVSEGVDQPHFYVFSDDIPWVKDNLKFDFSCQYVDHNKGKASYNDMHLMSLCRHHIIANSSFSWWGAWLNPNPEKIVVAPRNWFANDNNVDDLLPQAWIRL
jgi:hypothetical protein